MSNLRNKAEEIRAVGEQQRGEFEPHGVPLRVYKYWLENTQSMKGALIRSGARKENFCHFWRVVAIWAPLLWVGKKLASPKAVVVEALLAVLLVAYMLFTFQDFRLGVLFLLGGIAATLLAIFGLVSGAAAAGQHGQGIPEDKRIIALGFVFALPFALASFLVMRLIVSDHAPQILFTLLTIAAVSFFVYLGLINGLAFVLAVLGVIAATLLTIAGLILLFTYIGGRLEKTREQQREARREYYREHGEFPATEPTKAGKFFSGLGDFFVLLAQVVRVNKWKICPIVEVKSE